MPRNRNIAQSVSTNAKRPAIPAIKGVEEPYRQILNAMKKNIEIIQGTLGNQQVDQGITTEDIAAVVRAMLTSYSPAPPPPAPPGAAAPHTHEHGELLELDNDDHGHYLLVNGSRPLGGNWDAGIHKITTSSLELTGELTLPGTGVEVDPSFALLIHSDHANGSQTFADSSVQNHNITVDNDVQHDTAQKVFCRSSIYFDGVGDGLRVANHASLELGSDAFCLDTWVRFADFTESISPTLIAKYDSQNSAKSYMFRYHSTDENLDFYYSTNGTNYYGLHFSTTLSLNTWYHVALTRSGNYIRCFVDGVQKGSSENIGSTSFYSGNSQVTLGVVGPAYAGYLKGWLDEPAIRTGVSIWITDFTPPTSAYIATEPDSVSINEISIDGTMAGNGDNAVPTEKATKTYVDALETDLIGGLLDTQYFTEAEHLAVSAGAGDAGKPIKLDAAGHVDASMINNGDIDHGSVGGLGDDDHTIYLLADGSRNLTGNLTQGNGCYIATDEIRARDSGGLFLRDDSGTPGIFIENSGNVGIKTTTPGGTLDIAPGTTGGLYFEAAEATVDITAVHTCTIEVNIPSGAKLLNVQLRVDAALAAGETWDARYATGATQSIAAAQAVAVNTKVNKFFDENAATPIASAEVDITIQRSSNPGVDVFTAQGTIRAIVYYQANTTMADV